MSLKKIYCLQPKWGNDVKNIIHFKILNGDKKFHRLKTTIYKINFLVKNACCNFGEVIYLNPSAFRV